MTQAWNDLREKIKQECLLTPDNEKVFKALAKNLGYQSTAPSKLLTDTQNELWEHGLKSLIGDIRYRQRDAIKCEVMRAHVAAGGQDPSGRSGAPYAKQNMVGPSARVKVHNRMAAHRLTNAWDMVLFGKQVKNMIWDDLDYAIKRLEPSAIEQAAIVHYLRELQTKLTPGSKTTVKTIWQVGQSDTLYADAVIHAHSTVKAAI